MTQPRAGTDIGGAERDHQLVERIRSGDGEAFEVLFHAYAARLCRTVYRYVKSWDVAEDLVQDVFLKIWRGRSAWRVARRAGARSPARQKAVCRRYPSR